MKASERILLSSFVVLLLVGGAIVMWDLYRDRKELLVAERGQLELDLVEIRALLEDEAMWTERAAALAVRQPVFTTREAIDKAIFADARPGDSAEVAASEFVLIEPARTPHYVQAGVRLKAEGTVENIFRWLHRLQTPETFRVVRSFKANPHPEDDEKILCDIELLRWYAPGSDQQE